MAKYDPPIDVKSPSTKVVINIFVGNINLNGNSVNIKNCRVRVIATMIPMTVPMIPELKVKTNASYI